MLHKKRKLGDDAWDSEKVAQSLDLDIQIVEANKSNVNSLHEWLDRIIPMMEKRKKEKFNTWHFILTVVSGLRPEPSLQIMMMLHEGLESELKSMSKGGITPFTTEEDTTLLLLMKKKMDRGIVNKTRVLEHASLFPGRSHTSLTRRINSLLSHFFDTTPVGRIHANNADPMGYLQPTIMKYLRAIDTLTADRDEITEIYNQIYLKMPHNPDVSQTSSSSLTDASHSADGCGVLKMQLDESEKRCNDLMSRLKESQILCELREDQLEESKKRCECLENQLEESRSRWEEVNLERARVKSDVEALMLNDACRLLKGQIDSMAGEKKMLIASLASKERALGDISKLYETKRSEYEKALSKFLTANERANSLEQSMLELKDKVEAFDVDRHRFNKEIGAAKGEVLQLKERNAILEDQLKVFETVPRIPTFGDIQNMCMSGTDEEHKKEDEKRKCYLEELEQDKITWGQEREVLQASIDLMKEQLAVVSREYDLLKQRHDVILQDAEVNVTFRREAVKAMERLKFVESENLRLSTKLDESLQMARALDNDNIALREDVGVLRNKMAQQQKSIGTYPSLTHGALPPIIAPPQYQYHPGNYTYRRH